MARDARGWSLEIACLCALALGCAPGASQPEPVATPSAPDTLIERQARILRAEDRRMIDDDLRALLHDADAAIRGRAVRAVGRIGDAAGAELLVPALADPDAGVRAKAVFALGLLGAEVDALLERLQDPEPQVRAAVADALARIPSERYSSRVLALLQDTDATVVTRACYALPRFERPSFAVERLIELTSRSEPELAFACTWALSDVASEAERLDRRTRELARRRLLELTGAKPAWTRQLAVAGLHVPTREEEAATVGRLVEDPDIGVRIAAIGAITFPGAPLEPFISKALGDKDDRVYLAVIQGLGRMRGDEIDEALARIVVHDERPWAREQAVVALGRAKNLAAQMANGLSRAPEIEIRRATAGLLLGRIDAQTIEFARRLYGDPDASVRAAVIPALAEAEGALGELLAGSIDSPDRAIRTAVARAAGRRLERSTPESPEWNEALSVLEREWQLAREASDLSTAVEVVQAAARIGKRDAGRTLLEQALEFPDWYVRRTAASHLRRVHGIDRRSTILPAVDRPLEHYAEIARWASEPRAATVTVERPGFVPGRFTVRLDVEAAPLTAWHFARLAADGAYDNLPIETVMPELGAYVTAPAVGPSGAPAASLRDEVRASSFFPGTLGLSPGGGDASSGAWFVTLAARPELVRHTAFGQVVQNLAGVVTRLLPGDRVVSVKVYRGDGSEPLPQQ